MSSPIEFTPSSLQRIRTFLGDRGQLKIKPWASAEEILEVLTQTLSSRHDDDAFWVDLQVLMTTLMGDFLRRSPCAVLPNEPLEASQRCSLLAELRTALNPGENPRPTFRTLITRVSLPSAAIMLLIGTLVTASCADDPPTLVNRGADGPMARLDANPPIDLGADKPNPPTDLGADKPVFQLDANMPVDATMGHDSEIPDGGNSVFIQRMISCFPRYKSEELEHWLAVDACFDKLGPDWRSQVVKYLDSSSVSCSSSLHCFFNVFQLNPEAGAGPCKPAQKYDPNLVHCSVPIYIGVRFE